ncbi:hypothetical protein [Flammeovirga aprica]|uniref:Uncharacterized protein n=1 Tax=Flammeovirga aprica JL-4 TaxID=694437 RepID=A0A7X9RYB4_9BACT|nr:hypothetical protein [Flammeovirga aprica]NME71012.1 hypothetical protein [Flammeovirga aprica JL-4]
MKEVHTLLIEGKGGTEKYLFDLINDYDFKVIEHNNTHVYEIDFFIDQKNLETLKSSLQDSKYNAVEIPQ